MDMFPLVYLFWDLKQHGFIRLCYILLRSGSQTFVPLKTFLLCFQILKHIENVMAQIFVLLFSGAGFERTDLQCSNQITCTINRQCYKNSLCQQTRSTTQNYIILKHRRHEMATHSLEAMTELETFKALEKKEKRISDAEVAWSRFDNVGEKAFVGYVHVYGEKSLTSLSLVAVVFYPFFKLFPASSSTNDGSLLKENSQFWLTSLCRFVIFRILAKLVQTQ